jgi:hypothetical protein
LGGKEGTRRSFKDDQIYLMLCEKFSVKGWQWLLINGHLVKLLERKAERQKQWLSINGHLVKLLECKAERLKIFREGMAMAIN